MAAIALGERLPRPARNDFFEAVYRFVRAIPRGRVMTYGQVAAALGKTRGARAVGWALRALRSGEQPAVPWHRVVGALGRIALRDGGGMHEQRRRLAAEGVRFVAERVDMRRYGCSVPFSRRRTGKSATAGKPSRSRARRTS
jgi:methylated-DNA-protein-cysteine methyltransferase-like protein